jgi:hypothetical protein
MPLGEKTFYFRRGWDSLLSASFEKNMVYVWERREIPFNTSCT